MRPIRVLHLGLSSFPGGVENFVLNYYRHIDKKKIQFDFICCEDKLAFEDEITELGGNIFYLSNFKSNPLKFCVELYNILKEGHYQIIHYNMLSAANLLPLFVAKTLNIPKVIVHSHNSSIPSGKVRKIMHSINRPIIKYLCTDYFACSNMAAQFLFKDSENKVNIINNAIDGEKFQYHSEKRELLRVKYNLENRFVIGHVGRFAEQKNHLFLIDIFHEISKKDMNASLLLIGDGPLLEKVREKVEKLELEEKVIFAGSSTEICYLYSVMDIFILPSLFEGLPIVGIEAQASSLPSYFSQNISNELQITPLATFISLDASAVEWADIILKTRNDFERKNTNQFLKQNNYLIEDAAKRLEKLYLY